MSIIRVALLGMKPRLRNILTDAIAREQHMEMQHYWQPETAGDGTRPDAVVCEVDDPLDVTLPDRLLRAAPSARVLMIASTGDQAVLYELQPARKVMLNVSVDQLMAALRFGLAVQGPV